MVETAETNFDEFKRKDCVFVADWVKTKGLHKPEVDFSHNYSQIFVNRYIFAKIHHGTGTRKCLKCLWESWKRPCQAKSKLQGNQGIFYQITSEKTGKY